MTFASLLLVFLTSLFVPHTVELAAAGAPEPTFSTSAYNPGLHMNPHIPKSRGPWFEGWYTRVSDPRTGISFAVIGASSLRRGQPFRPGEPLPGYLAILLSGGSDDSMTVIETFPSRTSMTIDNEPLGYFRSAIDEAHFEWTAENLARITQDEIEVSIPGKLQLRARFNDRLAWRSDVGPDWGPEGLVGYLPLIPLHWYVYSLGSNTDYSIALGDGPNRRVLEGRGFGHQEKNWGTVFPKAWIWSQAVSPDNSAQLAFTGGLITLGGITMKKWMLGYRSPGIFASFSPDQIGATFSTTMNACTGQFKMVATNSEYSLAISAAAAPSSFKRVSIPVEDGFKPGAIESFTARIRVDVYDVEGTGGTVWRQPIESRVFHNAALEFGAAYMTCGNRSDKFTITR